MDTVVDQPISWLTETQTQTNWISDCFDDLQATKKKTMFKNVVLLDMMTVILLDKMFD